MDVSASSRWSRAVFSLLTCQSPPPQTTLCTLKILPDFFPICSSHSRAVELCFLPSSHTTAGSSLWCYFCNFPSRSSSSSAVTYRRFIITNSSVFPVKNVHPSITHPHLVKISSVHLINPKQTHKDRAQPNLWLLPVKHQRRLSDLICSDVKYRCCGQSGRTDSQREFGPGFDLNCELPEHVSACMGECRFLWVLAINPSLG